MSLITKAIKDNLVREFERYRDSLCDGVGESARKYWSQSNLLLMRTVALTLTCCHGSSANTERLFSALDRLVTPSRNRLLAETLSQYLSIRVSSSQGSLQGTLVGAATGQEVPPQDDDEHQMDVDLEDEETGEEELTAESMILDPSNMAESDNVGPNVTKPRRLAD